MYAIIYHCWNQFFPLIYSITTLRSVNKDIKVYVLSSNNYNLDDFNVEVVPYQFYTDPLVSRQIDLWNFVQNIPERYILYSDTDVFWIKNPLPLYGDIEKVVKNLNDGFFYFDKLSLYVKQYFKLYEECCLRSLNDSSFANELWKNCNWYSPELLYRPTTEAISNTIQLEHQNLFSDIPINEHIFMLNDIPTDAKMVHPACNEYTTFHKNITCFLAKELFLNLQSSKYTGKYPLIRQNQISIFDKQFHQHLISQKPINLLP